MSIYKGSQKIKDVYTLAPNTNCLLNIPQNVKLELNNGVLTLKAGSEVYIPNGRTEQKYYKYVSEPWSQPKNPTGISATSGWTDTKNAFDGDSATYATCGTSTDYVEWNIGSDIYLSGVTITGQQVANVARACNVIVKSVNSQGVETQLGKTTGAAQSSTYTTQISFNKTLVNKLRFYLTSGPLGEPTTSYKTRIREIKLTASEKRVAVESTADDYDYEVPAGELVFDVVTIDQDKVYSSTSTTSYESFLGWTEDKQSFWFNADDLVISGSTPSRTANGTYWYDTEDNLIKRYANSTWNVERHSLPLGRFTRESGVPTKINQIFNGFGYIGSTVFVLPNVRGLIPDGINEDGSLKNIEFNVSKVLRYTYSSTSTFTNLTFGIRPSEVLTSYTTYKYDKINNYNTNNEGRWDVLIYATGNVTSGIITSFTPKSIENYTKSAKVAAVFKGSQQVYGKSTSTLARPFNPSNKVSLSTSKNTASKDLWVFTQGYNSYDSFLYTSKSDDSNQITLQAHYWFSGYTEPKGSDMTIVNKGRKYWLSANMSATGAYGMEDADTAYLGNSSYDKYVPKPNYSTGVSQTKDTVYYANKNVWVQLSAVRAERAIYVGKTSGAVTTLAAHNGYGGYSADTTTVIFIPKGWYYKSTGANHTRWLCEGE